MPATLTTPSAADLVRETVAAARKRVAPRATYRLQFNHAFTFTDAEAIVPYLASLGISHVYASPIFRAAKGSLHGYDVVDYGEVNPELGGREGLDAFVATLHRHGLGLILDVVPNHMGIDGGANAWWQDVIENGEMSRYAEYFDIDWSPLKPELRNKVLLPFLGGQYGEVLERGELRLAFEEGGFLVRSWETPFPLDPRSWPRILDHALTSLETALEPDDLDRLELESVILALGRLPGPYPDPEIDDAVEIRSREQRVVRHRLATLAERSEPVRTAIEMAVTLFNGEVGDPRSFDRLDALLGAQAFRLASWRVAAEEINYRRFFAINTLAAIRQEEPAVFEETHRLLLELLASGAADGVRIDHLDGLWDPAGYLQDLQRAYLRERVRRQIDEETWPDVLPEIESAIDAELATIAETDRRWPLFVVGEKILEHGEVLPVNWMTAGTVGYEFAQVTTGLFVDSEARVAFDRITSRFTGDKIRFPDLTYEMKHRMMREAFPSEVNVLTNVLSRIAERDRHSRDFTLNNLRSALREVLSCFPVYRTYTTCHEQEVTERDARTIKAAVAQARRRSTAFDSSVFDFIEEVLLLHATDNPRERLDERCHFAMKFQQLSSPVMAKGLEDTAFYRFNRLVSLNEVGADPNQFGVSVEDFHRLNRARARSWPESLLASSTHDTKRSEDVRARISVLSEVPTEWRAALNRWSRLNRKHKTRLEGALAPHRVDEHVLYQTLVGTWPITGTPDPAYAGRIADYLLKIAREASRQTNWINPNEPYEEALRQFVTGILDPVRSRAFLDDFRTFVATVLPGGLENGLAQQVLKLTAPGVPDIYQGTEVWDDSLVDPDNRRPVDFARRGQVLADLANGSKTDLGDDAAKLAVTAKVLRFRQEHPDLFAEGSYQALTVEGPAAEHVVAFARNHGDAWLVVLVPRLLTRLGKQRENDPFAGTTVSVPTEIATWRSVLDDREFAIDPETGFDLAELFRTTPVAILVAPAR